MGQWMQPMGVVYETDDFDAKLHACNRSAFERMGWIPVDEFKNELGNSVSYIVAQYDEHICDPQMLIGLAEVDPKTGKLEQVGHTSGFKLDRIDYWMRVVPTGKQFFDRVMENAVMQSLVTSGIGILA
jgi:hypothetical protein